MGERYLACLPDVGEVDRVCDKLPGNFLNLGLVALILPHFTIIHCRRDPLDTSLSYYFQHFTNVLPLSRQLPWIGHYHREHDRLMQHWRAVLPLKILEVDYEEIVGNQEHASRRMIEFVGLEWDDECLAYTTPNAP